MAIHMEESHYTFLALGVTFLVSVLMMVLTSMGLAGASDGSLPYFDENDPNIYISGLTSFQFSSSGPISYNPNLVNLGYTGKMTLDCYSGTCSYYVEDTCYYTVCEDDDDDYDDDDWDYDYDDWHMEFKDLLDKDDVQSEKIELEKKKYKETHKIKGLKLNNKKNSTRTCKNTLKNFFKKFNPNKNKNKKKIIIKRHPKKINNKKINEKIEENTKDSKNLRKLRTCWEEEYDCSYWVYDVVFSCSEDCHARGSCSSCPSDYDSPYGTCSFKKDTSYSVYKSCYANNMIEYWKSRFYYGYNKAVSKFNYIKNAVEANEECPSGMKQCGILDSHGNKLCISTYDSCPINYIHASKEKPESPYSLTQYQFNSDISFWYTNEATENGTIVDGLFVDSDLWKIYKSESSKQPGYTYEYEFGCEVLDTEPISTLLRDNPHLYQKSIGFDPYKKADIDSYGGAFLNWCVPGQGRITDLKIIKELKVEYDYNVTVNNNIIKPIKSHATSIFFCYLFAFIYYIGLLCFIIFSDSIGKACADLFHGNSLSSNFMMIVIFMAPTLILNLVVFILALVNNGNLADLSEETEVEVVDYLNALNHWIIWGAVALFAVSILSAVLSCFVSESYTPSYSSNVEMNKYTPPAQTQPLSADEIAGGFQYSSY